MTRPGPYLPRWGAAVLRPTFLGVNCDMKRGDGWRRYSPMRARVVAATMIAIASACACVQLSAQERASDRRKFLDPKTPVSDDPRRIPVKPGPRGPEGVLVLRGGRIFDGTGAAAHEGTLIIERNKIARFCRQGPRIGRPRRKLSM